MTNVLKLRYLLALLVVFEVIFIWSIRAEAHCDTLDGPVVATAKNVLEVGDVTPLLKWVPSDDERHAHLFVEQRVTVTQPPVLAKFLPMVRGDHDHRAVEEPTLLETVEQAAD